METVQIARYTKPGEECNAYPCAMKFARFPVGKDENTFI